MWKSLDKFMAAHPWHPRVVPFVVYVAILTAIGALREWEPRSYLLTYPLMCGVTLWLLVRYWPLTPELNWRFHWLAVPVAAVATVGWVWPGLWLMETWPGRFDTEGDNLLAELGPAMGWAAMAMRTLGMAIVVPMFEELFFRSALLRSLHQPKALWVSLVHFAEDLPIIGEKVMATAMARRYAAVDRPLARAFDATPLGTLSVFSVVMSSVLWAPISHTPRDWIGTVICGVLYALLVGYTNRASLPPNKRLGLGPVVWAHGLTNLFLCGWTVWADDWRFL